MQNDKLISSYDLMSADFPSLENPKIEYTFEDYLLSFVAQLVSNNNLLTAKNYDLAQKILADIYKEKALHANMQARLHYFLLAKPENNIIDNLVKNSKKENINFEFIELIVNSIKNIGQDKLDSNAQKLCQDFLVQFDKKKVITKLFTNLLHKKEKADNYTPIIYSKNDILEENAKLLPDDKFVALLERHVKSLNIFAEKYILQAETFMKSAANDVDTWTNTSIKQLDDLENLLLARLMQASSQKMHDLGKNFAKETLWTEFDKHEAIKIVQEVLDEYTKTQVKSLENWDTKIALFTKDMDRLAELCLEQVEADAKFLHERCKISSNKEHLIIKANDYMKKLAIFSVGAIGGASISLGLIQIFTLGMAALSIIANPLFLIGAGISGLGLVFLHFKGDEQKIKQAFLKKKEKKYKAYIQKIRVKLEDEIYILRTQIAEKYRLTVLKSFIPILEIMCDETLNLKLYLEVINKIKKDALPIER